MEGSSPTWALQVADVVGHPEHLLRVALTVAYFILFGFTGNFFVPAIAILSIGSTITWTLASVLLFGYKFDVVASILIVMVVGMSVDYAAHLVHFYNEMGGNRFEKVQGGCTAWAFLSSVAPSRQPGRPSRCSSPCNSLVQLIPILMVCGPVGETGDVRAVVRRMDRRIKGAFRGATDGKAVESSVTAVNARAV